MSLYDTLANCSEEKQPTLRDIEDTFNGNLCRCTGYRPILQGAKQSFAEQPVTKEMILDFPKELEEGYVSKPLHIKGKIDETTESSKPSENEWGLFPKLDLAVLCRFEQKLIRSATKFTLHFYF